MEFDDFAVDGGVDEALWQLSQVLLKQPSYGANLGLLLKIQLLSSAVQPPLQTLHGSHTGVHTEQTVLLQP